MRDPDATLPEKLLAALSGAAEGFAEESRNGSLPAVVGAAVERTQEARVELGGFAGGSTQTMESGPSFVERGEAAASRAAESAAARAADAANAVATAADRASRAASAVAYEARATSKAAARRAGRALAAYAVAALFAVTTFALLTAAFAGVLDDVLGFPWGAIVLALVYAIIAAIAYAFANRGIDRAKARVERGVAAAREEIRSITRPVERFNRPGAGAR